MANDARPFVLAETTWKTVDATPYEVAVLPWGATEAHNYHLPYATDNVQSEQVAIRAAERAWSRGARVVVLPTLPFGVNTTQLDIKLCINMNPGTQALLLRDIVSSIDGQGVHKLLVVNGHGGNDFRQMIRELQPTTRVFLSAINWWSCVDVHRFIEEAGDHAGEAETSAMMHLAPHLVRPLTDAGPGRARASKLRGVREGWAWAPRRWTQVTADTGIGNPAKATVAKGEAYVAAAVERIADFLIELAALDLNNLYDT
ncbi:MAG TPA: creatininase family protein [Gemmatimonadaceae bacterium]|jgi:creatinine amidohydrolase|nr:creatininase family protein [Gemmatimonadaceae bacterium]